jgi:hypothetical protein
MKFEIVRTCVHYLITMSTEEAAERTESDISASKAGERCEFRDTCYCRSGGGGHGCGWRFGVWTWSRPETGLRRGRELYVSESSEDDGVDEAAKEVDKQLFTKEEKLKQKKLLWRYVQTKCHAGPRKFHLGQTNENI